MPLKNKKNLIHDLVTLPKFKVATDAAVFLHKFIGYYQQASVHNRMYNNLNELFLIIFNLIFSEHTCSYSKNAPNSKNCD